MTTPPVPVLFQVGTVTIAIHEGYTITTFADGAAVHARHDDVLHLGQLETAHRLGYATVQAMNGDHDPLHSLLAHWLGLDSSPTLYALAGGPPFPYVLIEEEAILALQRLFVVLGIDVYTLLQKASQG